ncbi:MAG: hypothetical protein KC609_18345 [Myxococcales bacterium]|nr:hypothetical protein [Myxococcales bacterium]
MGSSDEDTVFGRTHVKRTTQTATGSTIREVTLDRRTLESAPLTAEEEKILRMRHGIGASAEHELEKQGEAHPEARAKLAMIEQLVLAELNERQSLQAKRDKVIDKLKKL